MLNTQEKVGHDIQDLHLLKYSISLLKHLFCTLKSQANSIQRRSESFSFSVKDEKAEAFTPELRCFIPTSLVALDCFKSAFFISLGALKRQANSIQCRSESFSFSVKDEKAEAFTPELRCFIPTSLVALDCFKSAHVSIFFNAFK